MKEFKKLTKERLKYIITGAISECQESKERYAKEMAVKFATYYAVCLETGMASMSYDDWKKTI